MVIWLYSKKNKFKRKKNNIYKCYKNNKRNKRNKRKLFIQRRMHKIFSKRNRFTWQRMHRGL